MEQCDSLVDELLALPDLSAQKNYLEHHNIAINDQLVNTLRERADQFVYADASRSLDIAQILYYIAERTNNPFYHCLALFREANAYALGGFGKYERAIELCDEAAQIYKAHNRLVDQADAQLTKIYALSFLGRSQEALAAVRFASDIFEQAGEWKRLADLLLNVGIVHSRTGNDQDALSVYNQSAMLYQQLAEEGLPYLSAIEQNRAISLRNLGHFEESIAASQRAMQQLQDCGMEAEIGKAQETLACTYLVRGQINEALKLFEQALNHFTKFGRDYDAVCTELSVCECLLQLRRFNDVLERSQRAQERCAAFGHSLEYGLSFLNQGLAYAGLRSFAEAQTCIERAQTIFISDGNTNWGASIELEKALLAYQQADFQSAFTISQTVLKFFHQHDMLVSYLRACLIAGRAAFSLNLFEEAEALISLVLQQSQEKTMPTFVYQANYLLGVLAKAEGKPEAALAKFDDALQIIEQIRGQIMVEYRAGYLEDKQRIYEDAVETCYLLKDAQRGFVYVERAKSRTLLELVAQKITTGLEAKHPEDRLLIDRLLQLRTDRDTLYRREQGNMETRLRGQLVPQPPEANQTVETTKTILDLEKEIEQLWHTLLIRNADYAQEAALWTVSIEPVQPYLAADTLLLEYFAIGDKWIVFLVGVETIEMHWLSVTNLQLQRLMRLLQINMQMAASSQPSGNEGLLSNAQKILSQLYTHLVFPVAQSVARYTKLIIVPHGLLHYIPFHAFYADNAYLLEKYEISYLPNASLLRYCQQDQQAITQLDCHTFGFSYNNHLPHTIDEAQRIAQLTNGKAFIHEEATISNLQKSLATCNLLHLATHADFRPDNPLFSGIAFADGWQTTFDVFNFRLNASLVTLSACQTGQSVIGGGDELLGLMRAFLAAGASSIVVSLWAIQDQSTSYLMQEFYQRLVGGQTKSTALRNAQLTFLKDSAAEGANYKAFTHPYYWAAFFLVGSNGIL